jgi:acyl-lipid omega-6 desaturase (Delta-12 desaturase)
MQDGKSCFNVTEEYMSQASTTQPTASLKINWRAAVAGYQKPSLRRSYFEIATSILPYFALMYLMFLSLEVSYWLTLALAFPTAGFLVRIFIVFHDCGHGSFFKSNRLNDFWGYVTGIITYTPYHYWRRNHAIHHATVSNLDRRGVGDVMTLTVKEYLALSPWGKLKYRIYRNPLVMLLVGPTLLFLVGHRFASKGAGQRERHSVIWTNLALLVIYLILIPTLGLNTYLLVHLPVLFIAFTAGVWLFYVQHQFENTYWETQENWDFVSASLKGSSFYKLPRLMQWFTGNIGFHHIHHLSPRIPNYLLEKCQNENDLFKDIKPLTLLTSLKCLRFRLWDEDRRILVGYDVLQRMADEGAVSRAGSS